MRIWIISFVLFFAAAELYQWVQGLKLPLPVFILLGGLLAIASNAEKWSLLPGSSRQRMGDRTPSASESSIPTSSPEPLPPTANPPTPISFTIRKRQPPTLPEFLQEEKGA
ncbi:MAG: hypothetical protein MUF49_14485 [Oculatellaceae cyanobacterium Prado106]|jgi:hypothetical protein|nr:hypothetical protein [Oculatellaceae cyanobacterium Prado106]